MEACQEEGGMGGGGNVQVAYCLKLLLYEALSY
jgi:hypothetical protein